MTTATQTCTSPKALKSILLPCPSCGEQEASIAVNLGSLDDDDAQFFCQDCEAEFGRNRIVELIRKWTRVLSWLEAIPDMDAE